MKSRLLRRTYVYQEKPNKNTKQKKKGEEVAQLGLA